MKDTNLAGFRITNQHRLITIRHKPNVLARIGISLFMAFWLTGWSVGCFMLFTELLNDFQWFSLLYTVPFFVAYFAGAAVILSSLFGTTIIQLSKDQLKHTFRVVIPICSRTVLLKEISNITINSSSQGYSALRLHSSSGDFDLLQNINDKKTGDLRTFLQQHIPTIDGAPNEKPRRELVARKRKVSPLNNNWKIEQDFNHETVLSNKGSFTVGAFLGSLGICLFWNGIVSVFIVKTTTDWRGGGGNWFETLFLIPFVLIGLAILATLATVSLDPFRKLTYVFTDREIVWSLKYFGIGMSKTRSLLGPINIEIGEEAALPPDDEDFNHDELSSDFDYKLTFTNTGGKNLVINSLTLAEAEWIGTELENAMEAYTFQRDIKADSNEQGMQ